MIVHNLISDGFHDDRLARRVEATEEAVVAFDDTGYCFREIEAVRVGNPFEVRVLELCLSQCHS